MHWLLKYLRLRNLLFALAAFVLFLMLIAAVGCTPRQQSAEPPPFDAAKPVDAHLTLVIDLSGSFHAQLSRDGKVMAYLMRVIQTFFEAGVGTERNDRLLIAVIDGNSHPIFFEGSTRQFQQSFASPDDLRLALFRRANPSGSRVHDTVCDAAQQALACDGLVPGKTRLSMLILSDMEDNKCNASTNSRFRQVMGDYAKAGGAVGIHWLPQQYVIPWREYLTAQVGFSAKQLRVTADFQPEVPLPNF